MEGNKSLMCEPVNLTKHCKLPIQVSIGTLTWSVTTHTDQYVLGRVDYPALTISIAADVPKDLFQRELSKRLIEATMLSEAYDPPASYTDLAAYIATHIDRWMIDIEYLVDTLWTPEAYAGRGGLND